MEVLRNLFEGYPNLWGGGVAHSVLILSLTIAFGIILAKIKVRGVSLGVTWILFVGINPNSFRKWSRCSSRFMLK